MPVALQVVAIGGINFIVKSKDLKNIEIRGARTHNLKDIDIDIPLNKITCIYGPSGSGKSSLAFHTLLAESKRRYLNSLPNDVKFFWNMPTAADVDSIYPVLPVWGLAQSNPILGSRPNLSDTMGLSDHLQRLWFDYGKEYCPSCEVPLQDMEWTSVFEKSVRSNFNLEDTAVLHFLVDRVTYEEVFGAGTTPARSYSFEDSKVHDFDEEDLYWEVFRIKAKSLSTVSKKIKESRLKTESFLFNIAGEENLDPLPRQATLICSKCDFSKEKFRFEPTEFSPYNAAGACDHCSGHGMNLEYDRQKVVKYPYLSIPEGAISILESSHFSYLYPSLEKELKKKKISLVKPFSELPQEKLWKILEDGSGHFPGLKKCYEYLESKRYKRTVRIFSRKLKSEVLCSVCEGTRVNSKTHNLRVDDISGVSYKDIWKLNSEELSKIINGSLKKVKSETLERRLKDILNILAVALDLGLRDIPLWKKAKYLSSSEYQRALLTKILSYQGSGSLFVLDEPSFDLSLEQQKCLYECLEKIREQGNSILLVEHSHFLRNCSDYLIEMGPDGGPKGGRVLKAVVNRKKSKKTPGPVKERKLKSRKFINIKSLEIEGRTFPALKLPLNETTVLYNSSGYRKNLYFQNFLLNSLYYRVMGEPLTSMADVSEDLISGDCDFEKVLVFDSSLGRVSSRSTVGTTIGLSPEVRKHFAALKVSKNLGLEKGHFSPNSDLGKCRTCEGRGVQEVEMSFLEDITLVCDDCGGKKLKPFLANISDGEITAYEAFSLPMTAVIPRLKLTPKFKKLWSLVELLNLTYLSLDRPLTTLSGGERMRIKLLSQLTSPIENSFLFFDNISSGLSYAEVEKIFDFISSLKHQQNTIVVVDQNPEVIERAESRLSLS